MLATTRGRETLASSGPFFYAICRFSFFVKNLGFRKICFIKYQVPNKGWHRLSSLCY
jgi:hypothetical protein